MRFFPLAAALALVLVVPAARADEPEKPKLTFTIDGKDLIVSSTVTVNDSRHVAWTHAIESGKDVFLYYIVFQNRDLLVRGGEASRSQKQIELKWKLPGGNPSGKVFHVRQEFLPNTAELKDLLPQLQKLVDEGEKLNKGRDKDEK